MQIFPVTARVTSITRIGIGLCAYNYKFLSTEKDQHLEWCVLLIINLRRLSLPLRCMANHLGKICAFSTGRNQDHADWYIANMPCAVEPMLPVESSSCTDEIVQYLIVRLVEILCSEECRQHNI